MLIFLLVVIACVLLFGREITLAIGCFVLGLGIVGFIEGISLICSLPSYLLLSSHSRVLG